MQKALNYNDIVLVPKCGILSSRDEADVSCKFLGRKYKLPICPANMKCVIDFKLAEWCSENDYFYILHRFCEYEEIFNWIKRKQNLSLISISVGVKQRDIDLIDKIFHAGLRVDVVTIDISHGYSLLMKNMIKEVKSALDCKVIAGNIFGDKESVQALTDWGADALKIGLAYGRACITKNKTGIASPMFSSGLKASLYTNLPLIGDGSIKENGDIAIGLRAGYDMLMAGSIFAACIDSPALSLQEHSGKYYKRYYGSASAENKGYNKNVEGKCVILDGNNMTFEEKLEEIRQDLSSAVSFCGGRDLDAIRHTNYLIIK